MARIGAKYKWDEKKKEYVEIKGSYEAAKKNPTSFQKTGVKKPTTPDSEWERFVNSITAQFAAKEQSKVPNQLTQYQSKINSDLYKPGAGATLAPVNYQLGKIGRDTRWRQQFIKDTSAMLGLSEEEVDKMMSSFTADYDAAKELETLAAARTGDSSVLAGKKGQELRDLKGLNNLYGYDKQAKALMAQNDVQSYEDLSAKWADFDGRDALLTVEDYYRGLYTPVMGDGMSAAKVDRADYAKAASDIQQLTGIDVRGLSQEQVQPVMEAVAAATDYMDYLKSYMKTEAAAASAQDAQAKWQENFNANWGSLRNNPDFAELSSVEKKKSWFSRNPYDDVDYLHPSEVFPGQIFPEVNSGVFDYMTEDQLRDFTYLMNQPDDGEAQAKAYLKDLAPELLRQRAEEQVKKAQEFAGKNAFTGAAAFLGARAGNLLNDAVGAVDMLTTPFTAAAGLVDPSILETDPNSTQYDFARWVQALDQTNIGNIANATEGWNIAGINIPSQIYSGVSSGVDSLAAGALLGPGNAAGAMAAGAYESARFEGDGRLDAGMKALFENLTERYSLESLFGDTGSIVKTITKNMLVEPTEELANMALNIGWDRLRNGSNDEIGKRFDELRTMGYTPFDASLQIASEYGREALATVISSAFGGAFGGAVSGTATAAQDQSAGKNLQSHGDEAVKSLLDLANTFHFDEEIQGLIDEQSAILNDPNGKGGVLSPAKIGRIFRETMKTVDENAQQTVQNVTARYVAGELKRSGEKDSGLAKSVVRIVADNGTASKEDYSRVAASDKAIALVEGLTGSIDNARNLSEKAARIAEQAAKKNKNTTAEETTEVTPEVVGETNELPEEELAAAEIPTDAEAISTMIRGEVQDLGEQNAESVVSAYQEGQDPVSYATQFKRAMQFGEEGRNLDIIKKSDSLSALTDYQKTKAYTMGRGMRVARAEEAAKNRKGLVKVGNIDTSAIRNVKLNNAQRSFVRAISKLAQAVGFNVRFVNSATNAQGEFYKENGSWQKETRTITIDVNAGRLSKNSTNYAMMQTACHELTHFIKEFADAELFAQYQDFVFGHLSEKLTEADLDSKISEMIAEYKAKNVELDRDGAIEEIVAEASGDALLKMTQEDFNELSQSNPTLMQKIGEFFKRWVGDIKALIKKAYSGQTARNEIAEQMLDAVDELGKRWNELLKNAAASARETAVQQTESAPKAKKNQPVEAGRFLTYNHIDQRTTESIRNVDTQLFSNEVEEAQIGFAAAAQILLADVDASVNGQKFFSDEGVTSQKRMTSNLLAEIKDSTGWTWDKIKASLQQFADMADGETMPKNTVTNREMELYLDEVLSGGYTTIDGQKVAPWDEYIEAKEQYQGSRGEKASQSAYDGAIDFVEYAFADVKFSMRDTSSEASTMRDQLKNNQSTLNDMKPVADKTVQLPEKRDKTSKIDWAVKQLEKSGYEIDRPGFGKIIFDRKRIKTSLGYIHSDDDGRLAAIVAIPEVLKSGIEVGIHYDHKDRRYPSITFAAPIIINGVRGNMAVAVIQTNANNYRAHRILMPDGSGFEFVQKNNAAPGTSGRADNMSRLNQSTGSASENSIAEQGENVKFSVRRPVEQTNTPEFRKWFKDSKIVNPDGTPKVMYHGSPNDFTVFDIRKAKSSGLYGKGFYFTNSASHGGTYGKLYEAYLSIQNPLTPGGSTVTRTQVRKFLEAVAENEDDYSIENYGTYDVNEILRSVYRKDAYAVIQDVNATAIGDMVEAVKLFNEVNGTKFDGIVVDTETVAFEATQIKSATDNIGTFDPENPDIRYQLRDPSQITDRELLANVMESAATNDAELDHVRRYRKRIAALNEKQAALEETNAAIVNARKAGKKADAAALQNKADILAKQIAREDGMLLKFEAGKPLQAVVQRERAALKRKADERVKAYAAKRVETVKKQEAEKRERLNQKLAEVREKRDQKLAALRQEKQDAVARVREEKDESFGKAKYRKRIEEDVAKLRTWVTTPTNKEHVPQFLRGPLGDMINALDFSSARSLNGGEVTQKDTKLMAALDAMNLALSKLREQQTGLDKGASTFATIIDLPYGYQEAFMDLTAEIKARLNATQNAGDIPINRMTAAQLKELSMAIRTLTTSIRQMNRLLANAKYESAVGAANATIDELAKMTAKKAAYKAVDAIGKFMDWTNTVPYYAFKRFGKGGMAIFDGLMNGWDKLAFNSDLLVKFANSAYTTKEVRTWSNELRSVDLSNGETVQMTTAQLMSLYCLSKRAQAVGHLLGGGIRIADIESKGKRLTQSENYTLNESDLATFSGMLTDRQRQVADKLQEFMSTKGAEWGNEVSMKRFGYEMFTERYYFPIETDSNNRIAVDEQAEENSLFRLLNMSATKALVKGANNALVVRDIFDVFTAHSSDMAKYNALGLQILDALKWLNYVEKTQNEDGTLVTRSVQKSLERAYGKDARQYIIQLIRDLNGVKEGGNDAGFMNKLVSNSKVASVANNTRVWLLQATSLPRAAYVINPKYLSMGLAKMAINPKEAVKTAEGKVGIAKWKSMGFYDTNISRTVRQMVKRDDNIPDKIRKGTMAPAGLMDSLTMGALYYAAEAECKKKYRNTPVGSAAWDKLVNDRVREIVYQTQVVDSTMTRSAAMRSQNSLLKTATSFMSEPTLSMNMLMDSVYEARMNRRAGESLKAPTAKMVKALSVHIFTAVLVAAMESAFDAERDDDEYETLNEKFITAFIGDLTENDSGWERFTKLLFSNVGANLNPLNNIPVINEFMSIGEGYDSTSMWSQWFGSLKTGYDAYMRWREGNGTWYSWVYSGLKGLSQLFGLPASNTAREAVSVWNTFFADRYDMPRIQTYGNNKSDAAESYYEAIIDGDSERAAYILKRAKINGIDEDKVADAIAGYVKTDYIDGVITESTVRSYLAKYANKSSDKIDTNIRDWTYQRETGFRYDQMRSDYIAGNITKSQMQTLLMQYRGYNSDEVYWQLSKWDYEKANGFEGGKYDWFLDAVDSGSGYERYAQDLLNHGVDKSDIAGAIAGAYKDAYLEIKGTPEGDRMLEYLLDVYESIGYDREYERKYINKNWKPD